MAIRYSLPADSFPITKVRGPDLCAGGAVRADRAAARKPLRGNLGGIFYEYQVKTLDMRTVCLDLVLLHLRNKSTFEVQL